MDKFAKAFPVKAAPGQDGPSNGRWPAVVVGLPALEVLLERGQPSVRRDGMPRRNLDPRYKKLRGLAAIADFRPSLSIRRQPR